MSHLLAQQPAKTNKPGAPGQAKGGAAPGEGNSVKANLNLAVDIINNCFNLDSPKSVQKIGLFKLQALLPDYKILYPLYMAVLIQTDYEIKQIILSDDMDSPMNQGEEIFYSFGNGSFNYKLKSDITNFDELQMFNSLIDLLISRGHDSLTKEHM